jgi:ABC-type spermidine/putrescine transport system permease subunit I
VEKDFHLDIRSRRRENRSICKWVSAKKSHEKGLSHTEFFVQLLRSCIWVSMEIRTYTWIFLRKGAYTSKIMPYMGCKEEHTLLSLSVVVFLSMGHYPYYKSLDFLIIKSSQYWFSL